MGAFFRVRFPDGSEGYQINDGGYVTDLAGNVLSGNLDYTTIDMDATAPSWYAPPAPPEDPPADPPADRHITKYAFRLRFTAAERAAVEYAAVDKADDSAQARQFSAALRSQLHDLDLVAFVDLDDPDLLAGVSALEAVGLLAGGRASEIVSAPALDSERVQ